MPSPTPPNSQMPPGPPSLDDPSSWPPPPPEDAPTTARPSTAKKIWAVGVAGLLIGVAVGAFSFLLIADRGDQDEPGVQRDVLIGEGADDDDPLAGSGDEQSAAERERALDAAITEARAFVEEERGLPFTEEIDLEVLDNEEYLARAVEDLNEELQENGDDLRNAAGFYQALGVWPAGTDPVDVLRELFSAGTLGFYDPETGEMVVRGSAITPLVRVTLVHELTHALDDQHFGLDRDELEDRDDEAGFAFSALTEGNASRIDAAFQETLSADEVAQYRSEEAQLAAGIDLGAVPPVLLLEQEFTYGSGEDFAAAVAADGDEEAIDAAFADPPTTTEQIMDPAAFFAGEVGESVPLPEADGEVLDQGVMGQFVVDLLLGADGEGITTAEWDGDNSVLWRDGAEFCVRGDIVGDGDDLEEGLQEWADLVGAEVDRDGDTVTIFSCG